MRPKDEYIAAAFHSVFAEKEGPPEMHDIYDFAQEVLRRAESAQSAAENPARTTCKTCGGMMVNPRPCRADNCGFRK